jgi:hypothetical protein
MVCSTARRARPVTGYALAMGPCIGCGKNFAYNPLHVPSVTSPGGQREPICRNCVTLYNPLRLARGLKPIEPHPDAYEPCKEQDLR